jgi:hypothetical protein
MLAGKRDADADGQALAERAGAASTYGISGVGWPSKREPNSRRVRSSSSLTTPTALYMAYSSGQAWPFEKIRWSLSGRLGFCQS